MTSEKIKKTEPAKPSLGLSMPPVERLKRAAEKRNSTLRFLAEEGYTANVVLQQLLSVGYSTVHVLMKSMENEGLTRTQALTVNGRAGLKRIVLYGLTAHGAGMASGHRLSERVSIWEPSKVNASFVMHHLLTQQARLRAEQAGWTDWCSSRRLAGQGLAKLPDSLGSSPNGVVVAVEVERFLKTPKRYSAVLGAYVFEMRKKRWSRVDYLCPSEAFARRMAHSFHGLKTMRLEVRGQKTRTGVVEPVHLERFRFYQIDCWPDGKFITTDNYKEAK